MDSAPLTSTKASEAESRAQHPVLPANHRAKYLRAAATMGQQLQILRLGVRSSSLGDVPLPGRVVHKGNCNYTRFLIPNEHSAGVVGEYGSPRI